MKIKYDVLSENIESFIELNAKLRTITLFAEDLFYKNYQDLSLMQLQVIRIISQCKPCAMRDIANEIHLTLGSVTQIIDKLEQKKYVQRKRAKTDRRVVHAVLTGKGQQLLELSRDHIALVAKDVLSKLEPKEQQEFIELFYKILDE